MCISACLLFSFPEQVGLDKQCKVVQGNFLEMPFEANSFDGAYAIEATCHAAKVGGPSGGH